MPWYRTKSSCKWYNFLFCPTLFWFSSLFFSPLSFINSHLSLYVQSTQSPWCGKHCSLARWWHQHLRHFLLFRRFANLPLGSVSFCTSSHEHRLKRKATGPLFGPTPRERQTSFPCSCHVQFSSSLCSLFPPPRQQGTEDVLPLNTGSRDGCYPHQLTAVLISCKLPPNKGEALFLKNLSGLLKNTLLSSFLPVCSLQNQWGPSLSALSSREAIAANSAGGRDRASKEPRDNQKCPPMAQDVAKCLEQDQKATHYDSLSSEASSSLSPLNYLWISLIALTFTLHLAKGLGQVFLYNIALEKTLCIFMQVSDDC